MQNPSSPEASWDEARPAMARIGAATVAFALWHSLLCSDGAKEYARQKLGARRGTALYRAFFIVQSFITVGALFAYILRQPSRTLYRAKGLIKWLGWLTQALAIGTALWAFSDLDRAKFLGIQGVRSLHERETVEAQAQGPELDGADRVKAMGAYRFSRHPIEWAPVVLLLASPVMKTNWLVFDILAAIYSLVGAFHEEKRLLRKSEKAYAKYQQQVAFFVGRPSAAKD